MVPLRMSNGKRLTYNATAGGRSSGGRGGRAQFRSFLAAVAPVPAPEPVPAYRLPRNPASFAGAVVTAHAPRVHTYNYFDVLHSNEPQHTINHDKHSGYRTGADVDFVVTQVSESEGNQQKVYVIVQALPPDGDGARDEMRQFLMQAFVRQQYAGGVMVPTATVRQQLLRMQYSVQACTPSLLLAEWLGRGAQDKPTLGLTLVPSARQRSRVRVDSFQCVVGMPFVGPQGL